jgi:hypothetical protein
LGEVPIPRVDGLELAAVDRNARFAEQFKTATHSIPARTLIARRDNLSATITALRERLATLEAPEWNYS